MKRLSILVPIVLLSACNKVQQSERGESPSITNAANAMASADESRATAPTATVDHPPLPEGETRVTPIDGNRLANALPPLPSLAPDPVRRTATPRVNAAPPPPPPVIVNRIDEGTPRAPIAPVAVAPDVAFAYDYSFALPEARISRVQQAHVGLCEKLGVARCRVTTMHYDRSARGSVDASVAFKLAPALASDFARDAQDIVEEADGQLTDTSLSGKHVGAAIAATEQEDRDLKADLDRMQAQLGDRRLSRDRRDDLIQQAQWAREQLRATRSTHAGQIDSVLTTPVSFTYAPSGMFSNLSVAPLGTALAATTASFGTLLGIVMIIGGVALPWVIAFALGVWGWRRMTRRPVLDRDTDAAGA